MIISVDADKAFNKIQHPFMIKTPQTMGIGGTYLNIIKAIYDKPTANNIFSGKKTGSIPSKIRNKTNVPSLTSIIQYSFGSGSKGNQRRRRNKRKPDLKRRGKTLTVEDMIVYTENCEDTIRKLPELISEFSKATGYKINIQKSLVFLYTNNEISEREIKESIPFTAATKRIKCLGTNLPKELRELYTENYKTLMKEIRDNIYR